MPTKKVKYAGKFGPRYGYRQRVRYNKVKERWYTNRECPYCKGRLKRIAAGIYQCTKCEKKFAGGAHYFRTDAGELVRKIVEGR
jgi:large subunit ribosomal protein L37Ae